MIEIETYFSNEIDHWRAYFNRLPADFRGIYNSPEHLLFLEKVGMGRAVCQVFRKKDLFIYFPGLLRPLPFGFEGYDMVSSWYYGGPLPNWKGWQPLSSEWMIAIISGRNCLGAICEFIRCDPNIRNHILFNLPYKIRYNRPTVIVNLETSWERIVEDFSPQNRRNLKKAEKEGLIVEVDNSETAWKNFSKIYQQEMARKNAPSHLRFDNDFFKRLHGMNGFTLFVLKLDSTIVGGFVSAYGANVAHHYLSAVKFEYWDKRPNNLLFTQVLSHFYKKHYNLFDFQGGREGVFRFKRNFSRLRNKFYTATCIYEKDKFDELMKRADKHTDYHFPPYRISL